MTQMPVADTFSSPSHSLEVVALYFIEMESDTESKDSVPTVSGPNAVHSGLSKLFR